MGGIASAAVDTAEIIAAAEVANAGRLRDDIRTMYRTRRATSNGTGSEGEDLIALAQKLARDAEHHALLSASLASQADRLMLAGLKRLQTAQPPAPKSC